MHLARHVGYAEARPQIHDGDILLWKPATIIGRLICWATGQAYSHASMAAYDPDGRLRNVEMIQHKGGKSEPLSAQVQKYPGRCEVWRPNRPLYDGPAAVVPMLWLLGQPYGWLDFCLIAVQRLLGLRIRRPNSNSPTWLRFCSESIAYALRVGPKIVCCPGKDDSEVSPGDLADPRFADYQFALFPDAAVEEPAPVAIHNTPLAMHHTPLGFLLLFVALAVPFAGCDVDGPWPAENQQKCWQDQNGRWHCPKDQHGHSCCPQAIQNPKSKIQNEAVPGYADVPTSIEQANWTAPNGAGSCMWAASTTMLRWFGQYELADWWFQNHGGGATAEDAAAEATRIGLHPLVCTDGDPAFLDWCDATRRPAAIHYPWLLGGAARCHAVLFVGFENGYAVLRDDNGPGKETLVERSHFLAVWRRPWSGSGGGDGRAWTLLATPAIPRPWR